MIIRILAGGAEALKQGNDTVPVEITKTGPSVFQVGHMDKGRLLAVTVNWTDKALESLQAILEKRQTLKAFAGHADPREGRLHRNLGEWIATMRGPYEIKDDEDGERKVLVGQMKVHMDTALGQLLANRILEAPEEVKFSLDYSAKSRPETNGKDRMLRIEKVVSVNSLDWVPESGYDNGLYMPALVQSALDGLERFFGQEDQKKEDRVMTQDELKEKYPEVYQAVFEAGRQEGTKLSQSVQDSSEFKALQQANAALQAANAELQRANLELDKRLTNIEHQRKADLASTIQNHILSETDVDPKYHSKVKAAVRWQDFEKDGRFEQGHESVELFAAAFRKECEEWPKADLRQGPGVTQAKNDGLSPEDGFQNGVQQWKKELGW